MADLSEQAQGRFIAQIVKDDTGGKLETVRNVPPDVFTDYKSRKAWYVLRRSSVYEDAVLHADVRIFFEIETSELQWKNDKQEIEIAWLRQCGDAGKVFGSGGPKVEWPELQSASTLYAELPPPVTCLVEGLLVEGGVSICSAPSKGHKTWTAINLGLSIASGTDFIGRHAKQGPVVYLNFELSEDTMHRRLWDIKRAMGIEMPPDLHIWNLRGKMVNADSLTKRLIPACKSIKPALIILDPFYKVSANSGAAENSNDEQTRILSELEAIASDCESALFIVHHFAKGNASSKNAIDRASGAGALARAPDAVLTLSEHDDDEACVLTAALRDLPPSGDIGLRWDYPIWRLDESLDTKKLKNAGGSKDKHPASELLEKLGSDRLTNKEWMEASDWAETTYRKKRNELVKAGKVKEVGGLYSCVE